MLAAASIMVAMVSIPGRLHGVEGEAGVEDGERLRGDRDDRVGPHTCEPGSEHLVRGRVGGKVADTVGGKVEDLGAYLREQRQHAKLSVRQLAARTGISNPYLSQIERGLRRPSAEVLQQIARGLRISAEALYVRAGILERHQRPQVETAIQSDPHLSARQKAVLLDIYSSFLAEQSDRTAHGPSGHVGVPDGGGNTGYEHTEDSPTGPDPQAGGQETSGEHRHRTRAVRKAASDRGDQGGSP
jgi:transcriptional regulator with XRE-family HTH domain